MNNYDHIFNICDLKAQESLDPDTKLGAALENSRFGLILAACNTLPRHVKDYPTRLTRPDKYRWIEHAERNVIYKAARENFATRGATLYAHLLPCMECARAIIQAGISRVVVDTKRQQVYDAANKQWQEEQFNAQLMLSEAGVLIVQYTRNTLL